MTIHLHFFGEPFIEKNGERIGVSLKKAEVVLFYLAMEGFVSRSRLTSLFWGDKNENQAANNLRNTIYLLRKSFPENVSVERKHLCLRDVTSDLQCIPELLDVERVIDPCFFEEPMQGFDLLELPELDEWLLSSRSAIKKDLVEKLRQRISTCYEAGLQETLVDSLSALLRLEPYEEDSVLELAEALCKMGSVAKAVSTFVAFRDRLKADIGVAPSERAETFWNRLVASEGASRDLERPGEFFCCREREIGRVLERVPADGRRSLIAFIHGEAGVGKTALTNRLVELLSVPGVEVFTARPHAIGDKYAYSAWNGIVSEIGRRLEERAVPVEDSVRSVLSGVFYDFPRKNNISYTIDMELTSERSPFTIGRMLAGLVAGLVSGGTPIFVFEDLHWFDTSSLALLEAFFSEAPYPFILIATGRPECAESGAELLRGIRPRTKGDFVQTQLAPFDRQETMHLCRATLPQEVVERKGEEYFVKKSEGMPLLLVEMLRILSDTPDADCSAGLKGVIMSRVGDVSGLQRDLLTALSAFGGGAPVEDIARVVERDVQEIADPLEDLLNRRMVFERTDGERVLIDFSHSNVRDYIYEAMPDFKKREYHRRIASAMRAHYSPQIWNPALSNLLCHHYRMAGMRAEELKQHLQEMTFHITLNHDLFPLVRDRTLLSCSIPFSGREETEHKIDIVRDLLHEINAGYTESLEGVIENKRMEASYLEIWGGYLVNWGEYREGRIFIDRALRLSKEYGFDEVRLHCLEHIGHHFLQTDNAAQLLPAGREILYLARGIEKENHMGIALRFIGMSMLLRHDFARAERVLWRSIRLFEDLAVMGTRYTLNLLAPRCYIGEMRQWTGDLETALSHFEYCVERCEKAGLFWGRSHFHAHAADVAIDMGDWDLMYRHIDTGHALFESCRGGRCGSLLYSLKAIGDARRGKYAESLDALKKGEILAAIGKSTWQAAQLFASAWLARLMEVGRIPAETFAEALPHSASHYADAAGKLYRKIGAEGRADFLARNFENDADGPYAANAEAAAALGGGCD